MRENMTLGQFRPQGNKENFYPDNFIFNWFLILILLLRKIKIIKSQGDAGVFVIKCWVSTTIVCYSPQIKTCAWFYSRFHWSC
jgi:hypothetical protein